MKYDIKHQIKGFEEWMVGRTWGDFVDSQCASMESVISSEVSAMNAAIVDALETWNAVAYDNTYSLNFEIESKIIEMD